MEKKDSITTRVEFQIFSSNYWDKLITLETFAPFLTFLYFAISEISAAIVCSLLCLSSGAKSQISHREAEAAKTKAEDIDGFIYASLVLNYDLAVVLA